MRQALVAGLALGSASLSGACAENGSGGDDDSSYNCATETRADTFVVGLEKIGDGAVLDFKLMSANPAPPARGDNTWILQINAMTGGAVGAPSTGASMTVTPFMPDHQHGTPSEVSVMAMPDAGQYQLSPVNMWMPGLWETTITATSATGTDTVVYRFCIPS